MNPPYIGPFANAEQRATTIADVVLVAVIILLLGFGLWVGTTGASNAVVRWLSTPGLS